jgi:DNA-binding transcriptional ArsR family regulator
MKPSADSLFKALGDPTRRAIFQELSRRGEQTVHVLTEFSGVSQPAVSKHLVPQRKLWVVQGDMESPVRRGWAATT